MNNKTLKKNTISGLFFRFGERILAQLVSTIVTIILARILLPEEYGIISLVTIFITICNVFVSEGLSSSLIQKKDSDELDFSTIFWVGILLSIALYFLVFFASPILANFYNNQIITPVLRVMAIRIPLAAFNSVQSAYVSKKFLFRKFFFATLIGTISSGAIGIIMAYCGFGVWSLVAQYLSNSFIDTCFLFAIIKWRPKFLFSSTRLKSLFSFGWKVLVSGLIGELYEELRSLLIAKVYSTADLSFYTKGRQFPKLIGNNISTTVSTVMFPAFSEKQNDLIDFKKAVRRAMRTACYLLCPMMIGFASVGDSFVRLILTEKWAPCIPFLEIFCLMFIFKPIKNIHKASLKAKKQSGLDLIANVIEKVIGITFVLVFLRVGTIWLAWTALLTYIIAVIVVGVFNGKNINYTLKEQIIDTVPYFLIAALSCIPAFLLNYVNINLIVKLFMQVLSTAFLYVSISLIFKLEVFIYIKQTINSYLGRNKTKTIII